jgi:Recombination endonuclease VII
MRSAPNFVDLTGQRFGKRQVIRREATIEYNGKKGNSRWLLRCDCGSEHIVTSNSLKKSTSCGCDKEYAVRSGLKRRKDIKAPKNEGHLRRTFGLSLEQFDSMLRAQEGKCKLCRDVLDRTPCVDHDHSCCPGKKSCGKCIRGLLCFSCNTSLGNMKDSVERLQLAIAYLENSRA